MEPIDIQYALRKKGIYQRQIAIDLGCSEMSVSSVIAGKLESDRIMQAVAAAIGKDPKEVFPAFYLKTYKRKRRIKR